MRHKNKHIGFFAVVFFFIADIGRRKEEGPFYLHADGGWRGGLARNPHSKTKKKKAKAVYISACFQSDNSNQPVWVDGLELEELLLHHPRVNLHKFELVKRRSCGCSSCFCWVEVFFEMD